MTIVEFLRARYDEDADYASDAAEQVGDGHWQQRAARIVTVADRDREVTDYGIVECIQHLIRHDPARVLADVEAKRLLLVVHQHQEFPFPDVQTGDRVGCVTCHTTTEDYAGGWCQTVRVLALPYAGHPDYDKAWRPSVEG